uniref:THAP domain-containing protein 1 n=1 Tax=Monopterus albus TaxID=43700 RepID=A0A3Q3I9R1_MONAL
MSRRKCVFGCDGTLNLFSFPKDPAIKGQWMKFVFRGQQRSCVNVLVCSRHFMDGYFTNKAQYDAGFSDRLKLKVGAVPTLEGHESKPHAVSKMVLYIFAYTSPCPQVNL